MTTYYRIAPARLIFAIVLTACAPHKSPDLAGVPCPGAVYGVVSSGIVGRAWPDSSGAARPDSISGSVPQLSGSVPQMIVFCPNTLTDAERRAGWRLLFDGKTFDGWRGLGYDSVPTAHWKIENGAIRKLADGQVPRLPDGQPAAGGDLMTRETFRDFELSWEWKISRAGNSGVKYNVSEEISMANAPNHAALGFEYQMLDDSLHEDNKVPSHRSAALYDLIPPNANKGMAIKQVGDWNWSTIIFRGNHGEHWLNGQKVVEFELGIPVMDSLLKASKYRDIKGFANKRAGHIVLQDHVDEVWFRSIKIRRL
ncbi:MAG: 3-keto-disaccharide hydrolase [Gemmatimonadaceae bacterium]